MRAEAQFVFFTRNGYICMYRTYPPPKKANGPDAKRTNLPLRKTGESLPAAAVTLVTLALIVGCVIQTAKDGVSAHAVWTSLVLTLALLLMDMVLIGIRNAGRYLKWVALGVFAAGVLVHFYGYFEFGVRPVPTTLLRSAIASAEMFFSESNLDGIIIENPAILEKHLYVPLYVIIYSSALSVSLFYLFSVFGKRLRSRIWLRRHRRDLTGSGSAPWFVMLGINDNAIALAKDLVGKGNPGGHVIFLEEPEDEEEEARISLSNLRDFFSVVDGPEERVRRLVDEPDVVLLRMKGRVQDAAGTGGPMSAQALCQAIGLGGLADWLSFAGSPEEAAPSVSLFVIGESEKDNLAACRSLAALTDISCRIYCHAHPEDPMVYYPDTAEGNGTVVEFVDTARLAVEQLKKECTPDGVFPYHPINYVDTDRERGCVTSTFTGLLLGFGQTGQEALDFLYSFGAFLGPNGRRSPFEFAVYDSRMEELSGRYLAARRGMDFSTIHFIESSVGSTGFWDQFTTFDRTVFRKPFFERVNYVIVSLGDDELNFRTGCDLFDFMCRNRKDDGETGRFIVMVHARTSTPLMEKKVAFFNKMYGDRARFALFGRREDTWRYDIVTNASLFELASRFYDAYRRAAGEKVQGSFMERHARIFAFMRSVSCVPAGRSAPAERPDRPRRAPASHSTACPTAPPW